MHRFICGGPHRLTAVLFSRSTQYPRSGHVRAPPGHRAFAGQHSHSPPSPNAHGAVCARAGSRQLRGSVTNGMFPAFAFSHCEREEEDDAGSADGGDNGVESLFCCNRRSPSSQRCTYVIPPSAARSSFVLVECSAGSAGSADWFVVAACPVGHDGGHDHVTISTPVEKACPHTKFCLRNFVSLELQGRSFQLFALPITAQFWCVLLGFLMPVRSDFE